MEKPFISECGETMDLAGLLEEHGDHLLRLCTLYLGDRSQAEDAVQDTFLRALRAWPGFRGDCAVETWLEWKAWEIAQRLHVPDSTVTVRLSRARGLLKERLKGWYYEQE